MAIEERSSVNRRTLNSITQLKWGDLRDETHDTRFIYNKSKARLELQTLYGSEWFVYDAWPATKLKDDFPSVALNVANNVIAENAYITAGVGVGAYTAPDVRSGAIRIATAGANNDSSVILGGDVAGGRVYPWQASMEPQFSVEFRLRNLADALNVSMYLGLQLDVNNRATILLDTLGSPNLFFYTSRAGVETFTDLGAPGTGWHKAWIKLTSTQATLVFDEGDPVTHTGTIPRVRLTHIAYVLAREAAIKRLDIRRWQFLQDAE